MHSAIDTNKCLDEIEGVSWDKPEQESHLVTTCHKLRKQALNQFEIEDFRIMIGQNISINILVPIALEYLTEDPLVSGDMYEGDLIQAVSHIPFAFWLDHPTLYYSFQQVAEYAIEQLRTEEYIAQGDKQLIDQLRSSTQTTIKMQNKSQ